MPLVRVSNGGSFPWMGMIIMNHFKTSDTGQGTYYAVVDFESNESTDGDASTSSGGTTVTVGRFTLKCTYNSSNSYITSSVNCEIWKTAKSAASYSSGSSGSGFTKVADLTANTNYAIGNGTYSNPTVWFFKKA